MWVNVSLLFLLLGVIALGAEAFRSRNLGWTGLFLWSLATLLGGAQVLFH